MFLLYTRTKFSPYRPWNYVLQRICLRDELGLGMFPVCFWSLQTYPTTRWSRFSWSLLIGHTTTFIIKSSRNKQLFESCDWKWMDDYLLSFKFVLATLGLFVTSMSSSTDPTSLKKMLQALQSTQAHSLTPQHNTLSSNLLTSSFISSNFLYNFLKSHQCMFCRLTDSHTLHKLVMKMGARWCCEERRYSFSRSC